MWYFAVPAFLGYIIQPMIACFFFCRCLLSPFRWHIGILYSLLSFSLSMLEMAGNIPGSLGLTAEILLLTLFGRLFLRQGWRRTLSASVLVLSVLSVSSSIIRWLDVNLMAPFVLSHEALIYPSDTVRECIHLVFAACFYTAILKKFRPSIKEANRQALLYLTVPVFFISLVERIIRDSLYGNGITADYTDGILRIIPNRTIHYGEIFFLQLFACACLLFTLFAYQKILAILQKEQEAQVLRIQASIQETYLKEARMREQKTRAFRHDIKNHLAVLAELLKTGRHLQAYGYLTQLEQVSDSLSYPVQTGNPAADALLGSKLFAAKQLEIQIRCEIMLPKHSKVSDLDWCILLSNALDNAIKACSEIPKENRYLHLSSRRKGNFYLLSVENSCNPKLEKLPEEGTGLKNIRTVASRYGGKAEICFSPGTYKLNLLFVSLQQEPGRLQQVADLDSSFGDIPKEEQSLDNKE